MSETDQTVVLLHLPRHKRINIEFENITYTVSNGRKAKKDILKGVSGNFKPGELTAIMGPSGAGKTSLLNILTGFQSHGMKGTVQCNGRNGSHQYKKESCYILQDDQLTPYFTALEVMNIASNLKLGSNVSNKSKKIIIHDVLETLGLWSCKNTRCGQLSGGQKKRLSIALELVNNPPVMFLDEPTTGLDSLSSLQCISTLKALARGGRTIICTIHQPSATIYEMFDHIYAMAEGHCIYKGSSLNTLPYLSTLGLNCPEYHSPADYLIEVASGEHGKFTDVLCKSAEEMNWRSCASTWQRLEIQEMMVPDENGNTPITKNVIVKDSCPTEWNKFVVLLNRTYLQLYRDWTVTHIRLVLHFLIGTFIGLFYFDIGNDASKTISNFGYLLITCAYLCYTSIMPAVLRFPSELPILKKERFNNWYKLKTYYVASMVADIPLQMLFSLCYVSISYFMTSQPCELDRFMMFVIICCLLTVTAQSVGIFLATLVNPVNGTFLGAISVAFMLSLAGFLVFLTHMSKPFFILSHISYLRYALQGLVYSIYGHGRTRIPCPDNILYCHYTTPQVFLDEIGMANINYWLCVGILCCVIIFLRLLAYCTLKKKLSSN